MTTTTGAAPNGTSNNQQRRSQTPQYAANVGVAKPRNVAQQQQQPMSRTNNGGAATPTNFEQLPRSPATLPLDYKTPEQVYRDALEFNGQQQQQQQPLQNSSPANNQSQAANAALTGALMQNVANQNKIRDMLKRINDSRYMYPAVAVITLSLCVIVMLFQRSVNFAVRCLLVVLLVLFIAYTAYQFRGSISGGDQAAMAKAT